MSQAPLRIGDPVQVHETSEVLTLVCLDNGRAWVRDDVGNHFDYPEEDLVIIPFERWPPHIAEILRVAAWRRRLEDDLKREEAWKDHDKRYADYVQGLYVRGRQ